MFFSRKGTLNPKRDSESLFFSQNTSRSLFCLWSAMPGSQATRERTHRKPATLEREREREVSRLLAPDLQHSYSRDGGPALPSDNRPCTTTRRTQHENTKAGFNNPPIYGTQRCVWRRVSVLPNPSGVCVEYIVILRPYFVQKPPLAIASPAQTRSTLAPVACSIRWQGKRSLPRTDGWQPAPILPIIQIKQPQR